MKKRILAIALISVLCGLTACNHSDNKGETKTEQTTSVEATTTIEEVTTTAKTTATEETTVQEETTVAKETEEQTAEEEKTTAQETTEAKETTQASTAATTAASTTAAPTTAAPTTATTAATTAATSAATQGGASGPNPYVYRGLELETDPSTGNLVVDQNGYYTKIGQQKPLKVKENDKGGTRIDVYAAEPGPYFIIDIASYKSPAVLVDCTYEGKSDTKAKVVTSWWDGKKLNVVLYCQQVPHNCLYVLDLSGYTDQIQEEETTAVQTRYININYKTGGVKYSFKVETISKTLDSSSGTNAALKNLIEDDTYYYIDLYSDETGDFRAKYDKAKGTISLE